jgi:hypothetical protein
MSTERIVNALHALRRRWQLLFLPCLLLVPLIAFLAYQSPIKYVSKSVILLQSANRGAASGGSSSFPRHAAVEQVSVIEAWLKSDHVLGGMLPQLLEGPVPSDPQKLLALSTLLRKSLTFELVGNSVLELRLEAASAKGLGRKLEIIVSRLLEGMLIPDDGILSAERMVAIRRGEALMEIEQELNAAVEASGLGALEAVRSKLLQIYTLQRDSLARPAILPDGRGTTAGTPATDRAPASADPAVRSTGRPLDKARLLQLLAAERAALSPDVRLVERLERQYAAYEEARTAFDSAKQNANAKNETYVRVFDAPANLTVVGRPRDPLFGESNRRKLFMAGLLFSFVLGAALVVLAELMDHRLLSRHDFESVTGVPVIARLPGITRRENNEDLDSTGPPAILSFGLGRWIRQFIGFGGRKPLDADLARRTPSPGE